MLTSELKRYEYVISPTGGITYGAPSGYHDDCVIALALANYRRWESEHVGTMAALGTGLGKRAAGGEANAEGAGFVGVMGLVLGQWQLAVDSATKR